ncbi:cobalt transport protein CbiQ [Methanobrevibacter oralis]|uniref:Cobalt transport protein CbiQ n=1 Tax=Methanobrevibacter oralis TaxID=66851 RepID=A0A166C7P1_METOA|nr:cobalt ECF transporter T component CbiQ [Methanobrevibacter oralis]KZX11977.1 cobalt transport protein CbiQ [Methanobrevibacter oralis]
MKFDMDYIAHHNALSELNPYFKLFFTVIFLIFTLAMDNLIVDICVFTFMSILILFIAKINYKSYLKFLSIPMLFVVLTCIFLVFFFGKGEVIYETGIFGIVVTTDSLHYGVYTFFRVIGCLPCLGFLALTTPIAKILHCLASLKVPKIFIEIALLMYNTIFIFLNELDTMQKAQQTRLGYHTTKSTFESLGALGSTIFLRSLDKSETLQNSLDSRGYTGELPVYKPVKRED